jgi:hypothetical protein
LIGDPISGLAGSSFVSEHFVESINGQTYAGR